MATILGRLMFDKERTAVPSAALTGLENVPIVLQNTSTGAMLAVMTDANGNYSFTNVPDGSYQIVEVYGTPAIATPGDFANAVSAPMINNGKFPPISYAQDPPAGATNLDAVTPTTLYFNVSDEDIPDKDILNGPVTYTAIRTIMDSNIMISPNNLITEADNGTFGSYPPGTPANTGADPNPYPNIGTEFNYVQPDIEGVSPNDGSYTIQNLMNNSVPNQQYTWWRIADHTAGNETGRMMIVNGDSPGAVFFQEQVTVKPNTYYLFSSWILNLSRNAVLADPQLGVQVIGSNGQVLYNSTLGALIPMNSDNPEWKEIGTAINTQSNTTLTVKFVSQGPAAYGNDYAIDDIRLQEIEFPIYTPEKSADKTQINIGDTVNYTVTLTKPGINALTNINFHDLVPEGMTFVPGSVTVNGQPSSEADPNVGFNMPDIQGGETLTVVFSAKATSVPAANPTRNRAEVSYKYSPVQGGIPAAYTIPSNEIPVRILSADLVITKTGTTDSIQAGNELQYRIRVTNNGVDPAEEPVIADQIPANLQNTAYSVDGGTTWNAWSGNIRLPSITPAESVDVLVRATVNSATSGLIQNTATVTSPTFDPNTSNNSSTAIVPVTASADLNVVKTASPATVTAGGTITYQLIVSNAGPSDAVNAVLSDAVPTGLTNIMYSTDGGTTWNNWNGTYNIGAMAAGQSATVQIRANVDPAVTAAFTNTATVNSDTPDPNPNNNTFSVTTEVETAADLVISKTADKSPVPAGEVLTYTVNVVNNGPSSAANTRITDIVPALLGNVQYSLDNGATWSPWNGSYTVGTLQAQGTVAILIRGAVSATVAGGLLNNTASVISDTDDPHPENNDATVITPINTSADLSVSKSVDPELVNHGQQVNFTVTVRNAGPNPAQNVALRDIIPRALLNSQYSLDNGATWQNVTGSLFILGTVEAGAVIPILFRGTTDQTTLGVVTNSASVGSDTPDPDMSNNNTESSFTIGTAADISITKRADSQTVIAGERLTYTLAVRNGGPDNATNVVLSDTLPEVILNPEFSADGGTTWQVWSSPFTIGTLPAGATTNILVRGTVDPSANAALINLVTNTSRVSSDTPDPNMENNTSTVTTPIRVFADLSVTKTGSPNPAIAGSMITYKVDVINNGPSNAEGILVIDTISTNITNPQYSTDGGITWRTWSSPLSLGTLTSGARQEVQIRGILNSAAVGSVANTAVITSTTPDPDISNNISHVNIPIQPNADISVIKTPDVDTVNVGNTLTYTVTVANAGPSYAEDVVLSDIVPANLANPEFSTDGGLSWSAWTGSLNLGTVASGASLKVLLRGTVQSSAAGTFINTAAVEGTTPDTNLSNNTSAVPVSLCPSVDLAVTKTVDVTSVKAGDLMTYTIAVINNGSRQVANVTVTDVIPSELENVMYSADNGVTWNNWNGILSPFTLAANTSRRFLIRGTVRTSVVGCIINRAVVKGDAPDSDPTNNHAMVVTPITPARPEPPCPKDLADLCIDKIVSDSCVKRCEYVHYKIDIKNMGPHKATEVILTDFLPKELINGEYSDDNGRNWHRWNGTLPLGDMMPDDTKTIDIAAKVSSCANGDIANTASVTSKTDDPDLSNNRSMAGLHIV